VKNILVFILSVTGSMALAQSDSADRAVPGEHSLPVDASSGSNDSFVVKLLRPLAPYEKSPMTDAVRLKELEYDTIGGFPLFRYAADAAVSQGMDSPSEWGQGTEGYAKRFANAFATNAAHQAITYGAATLFQEDNRYFASGKTTAKARTIHALLSPFETHREDGRLAFGYSNVLGAAGAGFLSRAWEPPSWQGGANIARCIGFSFLSEAGFNTFREFVPDLIRKLRKQ
jgi:hypothetical protein